MDKRRIKAVLFIIVFLLVMAVTVNLLVDMQRTRQEVQITGSIGNIINTPAPTLPPVATPVPTAPPVATPVSPPVATVEVLTPVATLTPIPTPEPTPTPVPTPTPIPVGEMIGAGTFSSDTGVPLNIQARWNAVIEDEEHVKVNVDVYLLSYQINVIPVNNAVNVAVGDVFKTANAPGIEWDENIQIETLLGSTEHILYLPQGASNTFPMAVEYHFGGTYSKVELLVIECGGSITLSR